MAKKNKNTQDVVENNNEQPIASTPKIPTIRRYELIRTPEKAPRGQASLVLKAAEQVKAGFLDDFVAAIDTATYKTKFPVEDSVKFHLHQLARQGFIKEEDVQIAA